MNGSYPGPISSSSSCMVETMSRLLLKILNEFFFRSISRCFWLFSCCLLLARRNHSRYFFNLCFCYFFLFIGLWCFRVWNYDAAFQKFRLFGGLDDVYCFPGLPCDYIVQLPAYYSSVVSSYFRLLLMPAFSNTNFIHFLPTYHFPSLLLPSFLPAVIV